MNTPIKNDGHVEVQTIHIREEEVADKKALWTFVVFLLLPPVIVVGFYQGAPSYEHILYITAFVEIVALAVGYWCTSIRPSFSAPRVSHLILSAIFGVLLFVGFQILSYIAHLTGISLGDTETATDMGNLAKAGLPIVAIGFTCILAPILEEALYRGFLMRSFKGWAGISVSSFLFAIVHITSMKMLVFFPIFFAFGAVMCIMYRRFGTLWIPIIVHALFNGINMAIMLSV